MTVPSHVLTRARSAACPSGTLHPPACHCPATRTALLALGAGLLVCLLLLAGWAPAAARPGRRRAACSIFSYPSSEEDELQLSARAVSTPRVRVRAGATNRAAAACAGRREGGYGPGAGKGCTGMPGSGSCSAAHGCAPQQASPTSVVPTSPALPPQVSLDLAPFVPGGLTACTLFAAMPSPAWENVTVPFDSIEFCCHPDGRRMRLGEGARCGTRRAGRSPCAGAAARLAVQAACQAMDCPLPSAEDIPLQCLPWCAPILLHC